MVVILVMWLWPFDYHYFFHPKLDSYEMYYPLALMYFLEKMLKMFVNSSDLGKGQYMTLTSSIHM